MSYPCAAMQTLQSDEAGVLASGTFTTAQQSQIVSDVAAILTSEGATAAQASKASTDLQTIITASGVTSSDVATIDSDLKAIQADLGVSTSSASSGSTSSSGSTASPPSGGTSFGGGLLLAIVTGQGSLGSMSPVLGGGMVVQTGGPMTGGTGGPIAVGLGGLASGTNGRAGTVRLSSGLAPARPPMMMMSMGWSTSAPTSTSTGSSTSAEDKAEGCALPALLRHLSVWESRIDQRCQTRSATPHTQSKESRHPSDYRSEQGDVERFAPSARPRAAGWRTGRLLSSSCESVMEMSVDVRRREPVAYRNAIPAASFRAGTDHLKLAHPDPNRVTAARHE